MHGLVAAGVVLTAIGSSKLQRIDESIDNAEKMVKAGIALLTAAWGILVVLAGLSFAAPRTKYDAVVRAGTIVSFSYHPNPCIKHSFNSPLPKPAGLLRLPRPHFQRHPRPLHSYRPVLTEGNSHTGLRYLCTPCCAQLLARGDRGDRLYLCWYYDPVCSEQTG